MSTESSNLAYDELLELRTNECVETFESARDENPDVDVNLFMPAQDEDGYEAIGVELLRVDLQMGWDRGQPTSVKTYFQRFSNILDDKSRRADLAFEEYRMRRIAGEQVDPKDYESLFKISVDDWPTVGDSTIRMRTANATTVVEKVTDSHIKSWNIKSSRDWPIVGDRVFDFELCSELGTGAFAKVFLANQKELADRYVVLKLTTGLNREAEQLAKLQHTNIVPIFSLHKNEDFQAVCMPDFGPCTLSDAIQLARNIDDPGGDVFYQAIRRRIREVNRELAFVGSDDCLTIDNPLAECDRLCWKPDYVSACLEICLQIAQALRHSHQQGIVHCDLKPANVLLASHGPVMLLDFNLSQQEDESGRRRSMIGGTLPYAAAEHLQALLTGDKIEPWSDIFSLGVILYELLAGRLPYPSRPGSSELAIREMIADRRQDIVSVRKHNATVPPSVAAIVAKLLAKSTQDRYQSMVDVCEDLQRQLANRPLKFAPNRSVVERAQKWMRRHPRLTSSIAVTGWSTALILILSFVVVIQLRNSRIQRLDTAIVKMKTTLPQLRALTSIPDADETFLRQGLEIASSSLAPLSAFVPNSPVHTAGFHVVDVPRAKILEAQTAMGECYFLMANAKIQMAKRLKLKKRNEVLTEARHWNQKAVRVLTSEHHPLLKLQSKEIDQLAAGSESNVTGSAIFDLHSKNRYLDAIHLMRQCRYESAASILESLRKEQPFDMSAWILLGNCYVKLERFHEAEGCFTTCAMMWPESKMGLFQRGVCRLKLKKFEQAERDFDTILKQHPDHVPSLLQRSQARQKQDKMELARKDLDGAIAINANLARAYFMRSDLRKRLKDETGSREDYEKALQMEPMDEQSFVRRGVASMRRDPLHALSDFQAAARINPRSYPAFRNMAHVYGERLKQPEKAIETLAQMLAWNPNQHAEVIAKGVMHARLGQREKAHHDAQLALFLSRDAKTIFQAACVYALTGQSEEQDRNVAMELLTEAIKNDPRWSLIANSDSDLDSLRDRSDFQALIGN